MSYNRRKFINQLTGAAGTMAFSTLLNPTIATKIEKALHKIKGQNAQQSATNEDFWQQIRQAYTVSATVINLNNGGVSPQPKVVQDAVERYNRLSNETPSYYMSRILAFNKEPLRRQLAALAGCTKEEIAIHRNTTESLANIIFGLPLNAGDEIVLTKQDYPNMINAWKQRAERDGIVLKWIDLDFSKTKANELVQQFTSTFTPKTKLVHLTHVINWNGQVLPVRAIADIAHKKGIEVLVDAAHSFAHLDFKISDLNCDYLGTSLHKWLCAPFGTGMLYVKKEKIKKIWPLLSAPEPQSDDIRKFENLGTRSLGVEAAIGQAIVFHNMIGSERKQARLQFLKNYWTQKVKDIPGLHFQTSLDPTNSCGIALFTIDGVKPQKLSQQIFDDYKIHTVAIHWENIHGVRVTPNVYTLLSELDLFAKAVREVATAQLRK